MAECYLCKNNTRGYYHLPDGGCHHLKEKPLPKAEDGVCKYIELYDRETSEYKLMFDVAHSPNMYDFLNEIIEKRKNELQS